VDIKAEEPTQPEENRIHPRQQQAVQVQAQLMQKVPRPPDAIELFELKFDSTVRVYRCGCVCRGVCVRECPWLCVAKKPETKNKLENTELM